MANHSISPAELQQFRDDTPGTAHIAHFNNAGSSLPVAEVVQSVVDYLHEEAISGGYETEAKYQEALEQVYRSVAALIQAKPEEIALVENASQAWLLAFTGLGLKAGDVVLTSEMEYVSNILGLLNAQDEGVSVVVVPNDEEGNFSLEKLEQAITPEVRLIAVTHIASTTGGMLPIESIGQIARKHDVPYLVDACQSAGQIPLDVEAINCDMLAVTGRKYLRAPRGTGFLFVRQSFQDKLKSLFIDGSSVRTISPDGYELRGDARRFQLYEKSRALTLGLGRAVDYALEVGVDRIWERISALASRLREELRTIDGVIVHDVGALLSGIVTFSVENISAEEVKNRLSERKINVSVGRAAATLYFMKKYGLETVVRASVHYYNSEEEIALLGAAVRGLNG
jgi:cysteine desulfurase / selenocysteine lyase